LCINREHKREVMVDKFVQLMLSIHKPLYFSKEQHYS
jgi:hypothetical protein